MAFGHPLPLGEESHDHIDHGMVFIDTIVAMMEKLAEGLFWYIAFLFSTTLHEASHALAAYKLGDKTAYEGGQLTLDYTVRCTWCSSICSSIRMRLTNS